MINKISAQPTTPAAPLGNRTQPRQSAWNPHGGAYQACKRTTKTIPVLHWKDRAIDIGTPARILTSLRDSRRIAEKTSIDSANPCRAGLTLLLSR